MPEIKYPILGTKQFMKGDLYLITPENVKDSNQIALKVYENLGGDPLEISEEDLGSNREMKVDEYAVQVRMDGEINIRNTNPLNIKSRSKLEKFMEPFVKGTKKFIESHIFGIGEEDPSSPRVLE